MKKFGNFDYTDASLIYNYRSLQILPLSLGYLVMLIFGGFISILISERTEGNKIYSFCQRNRNVNHVRVKP